MSHPYNVVIMSAAWQLMISGWFFILQTCSVAITPGHEHYQFIGAHSDHRAFLERNSTNVKTPVATPECIPATDGTCMVNECHAWRGPTQCSWGTCYCKPGYCAGADGKCYNQKYETVLQTFRLRNMRWPDMFISVSLWNTHLNVGVDSVSSASKFSLRKTPDGEYLISPHAFPNYAVATKHTERCSNDDSRTSCTEYWDPAQKRIDYDPSGLASSFVSAPDVPGAVMINSFDYPNRYWYIHRYSWSVDSFRGDPGTGGYWYLDPPLPFTPPAFKGRRCSYDCSASSQLSPSYLFAALFVFRGIGLLTYT